MSGHSGSYINMFMFVCSSAPNWYYYAHVKEYWDVKLNLMYNPFHQKRVLRFVFVTILLKCRPQFNNKCNQLLSYPLFLLFKVQIFRIHEDVFLTKLFWCSSIRHNIVWHHHICVDVSALNALILKNLTPQKCLCLNFRILQSFEVELNSVKE